MLKTIYDLELILKHDKEEGAVSFYQNKFYSLYIEQDAVGVITKADVEIINNDCPSLPVITVNYQEGWHYDIQYKGLQMNIETPPGIASEYVSSCQRGQVSAQVIIEKLNQLEEIMLLEAQRQYIENEIREQMLFDMMNPVEGEDCSHWRDKPWSPQKLSV